MGHHAPRLRRGRGDARPDRRPEAGDLRVPRRRRARVPAGPRRGAVRMDARRQLAQRPGAARGLRRALRRRPARLTPASPTGRSGRPTPITNNGSSACQVDEPLRVRMLHADDGLVPLTDKRRQPKSPDAKAFIARDLAAEVVQLLADAPELITPEPGRRRVGRDDGAPRPPRRAGASEQPGRDRARRAARRRRPGGDRRIRARSSPPTRRSSGSASSRRWSGRRRGTAPRWRP